MLLLNTGGFPLVWELADQPFWMNTTPTNAMIAPQESATLTLSDNGIAATLVGNQHNGTVLLTDDNGGAPAELAVELIVLDALPAAWRIDHFGHAYRDKRDLARPLSRGRPAALSPCGHLSLTQFGAH